MFDLFDCTDLFCVVARQVAQKADNERPTSRPLQWKCCLTNPSNQLLLCAEIEAKAELELQRAQAIRMRFRWLLLPWTKSKSFFCFLLVKDAQNATTFETLKRSI